YQFLGQRRAREVVRRQPREIARPADLSERPLEDGASVPEALATLAVVERRVDVRGRRLARVVREQKHDPVVLREVERGQRGTVALAQLRALGEEERDVGAELGGELAQPLGSERIRERFIRESERCSCVGAAAAEAGGDR